MLWSASLSTKVFSSTRSKEGARQRPRRLAAHRAEVGSLERLAVEQAPGHRFGAAPLDPLLVKIALTAGEEPQVGAHACTIVGDEPFEPAIVIAMPVAQD